jgi:DNA-binding SARP family transcriptional activator
MDVDDARVIAFGSAIKFGDTTVSRDTIVNGEDRRDASPARPGRPGRPGRPAARLFLLNGFDLEIDGRSVALPTAAQRLLGFLALRDRPVRRDFAAATLWTDSTEARAQANLRSALSRLRGSVALVASTGRTVQLGDDVWVDMRDVVTTARAVLRGDADVEIDAALLGADLLPGWYDDWVVVEQERLRQLRLHALEAHCERLRAEGRFGEAIDAGLTAVAADPLRESAHRALILVHLAEGNQCETLRQYERYRAVLADELGLEPSAELRRLVRPPPVNRRAVRRPRAG